MGDWIIIKDLSNLRNLQAVYNQVTRYVARDIVRGCSIETDEQARYWWDRRQALAQEFEKRTGLLLKINTTFRASFEK